MPRLKASILVMVVAACLLGGCERGPAVSLEPQPPTTATGSANGQATSGANPQQSASSSDWMKLVPFPAEAVQNHWDLPDGEVLVEVNEGPGTDECNIYMVVDAASRWSDAVARLAVDPKFSAVVGDDVQFVCSTKDFKPSFPYLLVYNLKDRTSAIRPIYYSVNQQADLGLDLDTPKLLSVSVVPEGIELKFDIIAGGGMASPKTVISGDAQACVLSVKLFGVSPATELSKPVSNSESCDLVSSVEVVDGADGQKGLTLNLSLNPAAWGETVYTLRHVESENILQLADDIEPTSLPPK